MSEQIFKGRFLFSSIRTTAKQYLLKMLFPALLPPGVVPHPSSSPPLPHPFHTRAMLSTLRHPRRAPPPRGCRPPALPGARRRGRRLDPFPGLRPRCRWRPQCGILAREGRPECTRPTVQSSHLLAHLFLFLTLPSRRFSEQDL